MSNLGVIISVFGGVIAFGLAAGAVLASIRKGYKNEIIEDQGRRIVQLESEHLRNKEEIAELRGEIKVMRNHFNETAISIIVDGVVAAVDAHLQEKSA